MLDGRQTRLADLQFACGALPFLADRRLVVAEGMLRRSTPARTRAKAQAAAAEGQEDGEGAGGTDQKALIGYLGEVPETTELVLIEEELVSGKTILRRLQELQRKGERRSSPARPPGRASWGAGSGHVPGCAR